MRNLRKLVSLCILVTVVLTTGCPTSPTLPPATPGGGFILQTSVSIDGSFPITAPGVTVQGAWQNDAPGAAGDPSAFTVTTNALALADLGGKRAPAAWKLTWIGGGPSSECTGVTATNTIQLNALAEFLCEIITVGEGTVSAASFYLAPNPVYLSQPPSSGTVYTNAGGLTTTYGMPLVQYYAMDGTLAGQENATSVSSNGQSMQLSGFNLSQLPHGAYAAFVSNAASGGKYTYLGNGAVNVADGGVFIDGYEQSTQVCHHWLAGGDCQQWVTYYDAGTVSITINGVPCSVSYGSNSTSFTIAIGLANAINSNTSLNSIVQAVVVGTTVMLNSVSGAQYSLSASASTSQPRLFPGGSFSVSASGSTF